MGGINPESNDDDCYKAVCLGINQLAYISKQILAMPQIPLIISFPKMVSYPCISF